MVGQQSKLISRGIRDDFELWHQFKMSSLIPRDNSFDCCTNTHETTDLLPNNYSNYYINDVKRRLIKSDVWFNQSINQSIKIWYNSDINWLELNLFYPSIVYGSTNNKINASTLSRFKMHRHNEPHTRNDIAEKKLLNVVTFVAAINTCIK